MNLAQFIETYQDAITQAVLRTYPPVYTARNRDQWGFDLRQMRRRPLGAQSDAIRAVAVSLQRHRGTNLVGEMGTGKTTIGTAAAFLAGFSSVLVLCPPHLVRKWQREVVATVPFVRTAIATSISDLHRLRASEGAPLFVILSRERAKLSYRWTPAVIERLAVSGGRPRAPGPSTVRRGGRSGQAWASPLCTPRSGGELTPLRHPSHSAMAASFAQGFAEQGNNRTREQDAASKSGRRFFG